MRLWWRMSCMVIGRVHVCARGRLWRVLRVVRGQLIAVFGGDPFGGPLNFVNAASLPVKL